MRTNEKLLIGSFILFALLIFPQIIFAVIPPKRISTTSISEPSFPAKKEKIVEINFTINQSNQIILSSLSVKTLPQAVINPSKSDFSLAITDSSGHALFRSNILAVFDPNTNLSPEYYAIPYPNGARYVNFYYQNSQIARYDIPQEFPVLYVVFGIIIVVVLIVIYLISRKYTIQV
jgi:hypothetical protein